ncbi:chitinase [Corallococcus praedator]|uniref:Chitinase n=1 Tax=Corallococcus praedator TaxID=2316724 RepID=A0ABX9QRB5_9BACT|nr:MULTISPECIES: glycoside hydrolase family 19 protein [Corallococcus]RKH21188.1 chitinase [Corallococcus sp. CA047B]RKH35926.1 chitinase [Corallococcus sp. CA031C]RKI17610.1 chitinase [Corallococcus praedator]
MANTLMFRCLSLMGMVGALGGCSGAEPSGEAPEALGQQESPAIVSSIVEGDYVIRSAMTNKCIDVASSSTADGAKVQEWDCNGTNAQKFHISPTSGGYFKIINVNSGKGLDVKDVSTAQNAIIHQWSYLGGNNQQFRFVNRGGTQFSMHLRHTDMAVDLSWGSADNGTPLLQYPYGNTANQHWTFDLVSGGGGGGTGFGGILTRDTFNAMFPSRNGFYTYDALIAAASGFPGLATTGDTDTRKREVAAFLANVNHETGGLVYIEEINKADYCDTSWGPPGCFCAPGKRYYGRGPMQLSWNGNYCAAGNALGLPLQANPDLLAQDANAAWRTGFWFWTTQNGAGSMTAHNAIVNGAGFGETIRTINGSRECNGANPGQVQSRIDAFVRFCGMLGVSPGNNLGC